MSAGDAALASISRALRELARVPAQVASDGSEAIAELIQQEFDVGQDPYDAAWAPLAPATVAKGRGAPPLTDTGALSAVEVTPMAGAGISITVGADYGAFHQTGTRDMPARPILPTGPLPATWERALDDAAEQAFERTLGGSK